MKIAGLDVSPSSPGIVKLTLNSNLDIVEKEFLGFKEISLKSKEKYLGIHTYKEFPSFYHCQDFMIPIIMDFLSDIQYAAFEEYAFAAAGKITMLAEIAGNLKSRLFTNGVKLRFYDPSSLKIFATGKGNSKKPDMFDFFDKHPHKLDISHLQPIPVHKKGKNAGLRNKDGISPLSDIVDAFFLVELLRNELIVKNQITPVKSLDTNTQRILTRTTKITKTDLVNQSFIHK